MPRPKTFPRPINVREYSDLILKRYRDGCSVRQIVNELQESLPANVCVRSHEISDLLKQEGIFRTHSETMKKASDRLTYHNTCEGCKQRFTARRYNHIYCKICAPDPRSWTMLAVYGLTFESYNDLLRRQHEACAICHRSFAEITPHKNKTSSITIDHDHTSNRVRGLLCSECNVTVGHIEKKPDGWLTEALKYLGKDII
jgi:hypothetical protein